MIIMIKSQNVELSLEIDDSLSYLIDSKNELNREIYLEITDGLDKILEILGIPSKSKSLSVSGMISASAGGAVPDGSYDT